MMKKIVLDCDGVLLDYNETYGRVLNNFFQKEISIKDSLAYHAENYYELVWKNNTERETFFEYFNIHGWSNMKALPKALEATQLLKDMGYHICVVTSIPQTAKNMRKTNLLELGFPIDEVIATGKKEGLNNPKKKYIENISPEYFVDDLLVNFQDINSSTNFVLIDIPAKDNPNNLLKNTISLHSEHYSLWDFVQQHLINKK